jgi:hypothetical protein
MEFGKVSHIEEVDFALPPDDPITDQQDKDFLNIR